MRFNYIRPIMLILVAYTAKTLSQTIAMMAGMPELQAENLGYLIMIIAGVITFIYFRRQSKQRR
ncbi:hypothetical protein PRECH8_11810 [Insulibacter thermoxylanivorax]|uniref:Uncharacterized protein n=1 Tax=Insulibacter thermoxylanivorax TaxID=2749268 RepID=A0A916QBV5_9BACL|nr:hypothetical protein [Insulibacter thermoxylanivorax]GFR37885.1 hypothetical protein PRECH8_11810 [Insulibacter thermoxylanivorax]